VELDNGAAQVAPHPFPPEWGPPPPMEKRRAWILRNVRAGQVRAHSGEHVGWLAPELRRNLSGREALRRIETQIRNENRLRLVEVLAKACPPG